MITKKSIEGLKDYIDIVDIIGSSLDLSKNGANFKACCPFHGEDTPSFVVSPTKQIYHCFGCGVGGDAIKFEMDYHKLSHPESLEKIANDLNYTLEYADNNENKDYAALMENVNAFYEKHLTDEKLQYLLDRGITKESIEKFEIGYAPSSNHQIQYLKEMFLNQTDAIDTGVLATDKEKVYARQIHRITFPIRNHTAKLIGFGGRTLKKETNIAKYINSPQTKLFHKSRNLYGFHIAKEAIYKKGTMTVTEGYLDVVMMHQANIKTAVATLGTALTKEHCLLIKKIGCKVLLCYDGDIPGREAAYKASMLLSQHEIDGGVVIFADGIDPADMVKENRIEELYSIMKRPISLIKYVLEFIVKKYDLINPHNKNVALKECIEFLKSLNNLVIANEYIGYLSKLLNIQSRHISLGQTPILPTQQIRPTKHTNRADDKLLKSMIENSQFIDAAMIHMDYEVMGTNVIFEAIIEGDFKKEILIPLQIRDDIIVYDETDFIAACKLKQKSYLEDQLKALMTSNSDDAFSQMDVLKKRLENL